MTITQFGASGLSGLVRERFGTIALLVVPTVLAAGGLALFALAETWPVMIAAAAILGAGLGLLDAAVNMEAALKRGVRFMGALHASWALGATLGPVLIGAVSTDCLMPGTAGTTSPCPSPRQTGSEPC